MAVSEIKCGRIETTDLAANMRKNYFLVIFLLLSMAVILKLNSYQSKSFLLTSISKENDYMKYTFQDLEIENLCKAPTVMISMIFHDFKSFGFDDDYNPRDLSDVLSMYHSLDYPRECISLALSSSDPESFELSHRILKTKFPFLGFRKVTLVFKEFIVKSSREERHSDNIQTKRRRLLAEARNFLAATALDDEDALFWLDSDIIKLPPLGLLQVVNSNRDIIHMRCSMRTYSNYDLNAWKLHNYSSKDNWRHRGGRTHLHDYENGDIDIIPLDSVGGTNLYLQADLVRRGLHFPNLYIVGTSWSRREGNDGIETEGLCYLARSMGSECSGMPLLEVRHSPV